MLQKIIVILEKIEYLFMFDFPGNKKMILFDGVCNLCNQTVLKIIKLDKKDIFRFTSLQSKAGKAVINYLGIDISKIDSVILYEPSVAYYTKSSAALRIMNHFGGFWKLSQIFRILPLLVRDSAYDFISKNRYQWFGKKEQCMIPTSKLISKFFKLNT